MIEALLTDALLLVVGLGMALAGAYVAERLRRDEQGHYKRRSTDE
jgi:hypothetical protein